ncbi:MAG: hypothetical protein HUU38_24480, partial [Anaerolineales bacterium]|nr:hypothetical protein [Anaerolineales bacterium]
MQVGQAAGDPGSERVAGCDLGKATATFVVADVRAGGFVVESVETVVHNGRPMDAFCEWYRRNDISSCLAIGATGLHADELTAPVLRGLPEDACLGAALDGHTEIRGPVNIVSIGARGYSVLTRDTEGHIQYLENDKCSSGTGETMVKIAGRFGLSITDADAL